MDDRKPASPAAKGSQHWLQFAVNERPETIGTTLRSALSLPPDTDIDWRSPRADDAYGEYRDGAFLVKVGLERLEASLKEFWPAGGPRWDGLACTSRGDVLLLEAKSHVAEMLSVCKASDKSRPQIEESLARAKAAFKASPESDWTRPLYQYANRLAHLDFLRRHGVPAWLVNVYFVNDRDMAGPQTVDHWQGAVAMAKHVLGLGQRPVRFAVDVFLDVQSLAD